MTIHHEMVTGVDFMKVFESGLSIHLENWLN